MSAEILRELVDELCRLHPRSQVFRGLQQELSELPKIKGLRIAVKFVSQPVQIFSTWEEAAKTVGLERHSLRCVISAAKDPDYVWRRRPLRGLPSVAVARLDKLPPDFVLEDAEHLTPALKRKTRSVDEAAHLHEDQFAKLKKIPTIYKRR